MSDVNGMSSRRFASYALVVLVPVSVTALAYLFRGVLAPFIAAYILQFVLQPIVSWLVSKDMSHRTAVIVVFSVFLAISSFIVVLIVPALFREIADIAANRVTYAALLSQSYDSLITSLRHWGVPLPVAITARPLSQQIAGWFAAHSGEVMALFTKNIIGLAGAVVSLTVIPFATFFFLFEDQRIKHAIVGMVPNRFFEVTVTLLNRLHAQVGMILGGMVVSVFVFSTLSTIGVWLIGLDYPIVVGVFAGVVNLIPYLGPVAGAAAAALVVVLGGEPTIMLLWIALVFLVVNIIDNTLTQPLVLSKAANLHPLAVMVIVLVGSQIGGVLGMLLAVPLASLFQVVFSVFRHELFRPPRPPFSAFTLRA